MLCICIFPFDTVNVDDAFIFSCVTTIYFKITLFFFNGTFSQFKSNMSSMFYCEQNVAL